MRVLRILEAFGIYGTPLRLPNRLRSSRLKWAVKLALKRLSGRELWIRPTVSLASVSVADWQYSETVLNAGKKLVYSLGVGDSIAFDQYLIETYGAEVHAFDPTPFAVEWLANQDTPKGFHFHQWAVAGEDGELWMAQRANRKGIKSGVMWQSIEPDQADEASIQVPCFCLASIVAKLSHEKIDLLKIDIEGMEYPVLESLSNMKKRPTQILVEFHHRFADIDKSATRDAVNALLGMGYQVFSVSQTGREIGFVQTAAVPLN